ncbi:hypothetical protein WMY93_008868 [Mugilogobius chulae]|uniref:Cadherin domain-containing protein n=1 Tax=Mugilogobius chulae TaxID=88201 RepID=A0AAW0PB44_9GOBI
MRFTHPLYNTSIFENSVPRTYVETPIKMGIELVDLLWEIQFSIVSGDDDELFQAEALKVGDFAFLRIKTRFSDSASLNREVRDVFALTVEATESTFELKAKTKVIVQVLDTNDLKPLFYPASYTNAEFYYSFTTRTHPFTVDLFTGTVSLSKKLNHTRNAKYDLTVLAEDRIKRISGVQKFGNFAKVTVNVQQTNKRTQLSRQHRNLQFRLMANHKTGIIVTNDYFDFETKRRYEFDVIANNGEAETHIVVEITDENETRRSLLKTLTKLRWMRTPGW